MISTIYTLWKIYCIIRAIHGVFITVCFFRWILGKSYYPIITIFSYFYEKKEKVKVKFNIEEKDDYQFISYD
jgi:hypothetical protein